MAPASGYRPVPPAAVNRDRLDSMIGHGGSPSGRARGAILPIVYPAMTARASATAPQAPEGTRIPGWPSSRPAAADQARRRREAIHQHAAGDHGDDAGDIGDVDRVLRLGGRHHRPDLQHLVLGRVA